MFIKRMMRIHRRAKEALAFHYIEHQERTDSLIRTLREVVTAYETDGGADKRLAAIGSALSGKSAQVLEQCEAHEAHAGNNYYPFLWRFYASYRPTLFRIWQTIQMKATSQDFSLENALTFILKNEHSRAEWVPLLQKDEAKARKLDLSWVPDSWWRLVTGQTRGDFVPYQVNRRYLELCVFTQQPAFFRAISTVLILLRTSSPTDIRKSLLLFDFHFDGIYFTKALGWV